MTGGKRANDSGFGIFLLVREVMGSNRCICVFDADVRPITVHQHDTREPENSKQAPFAFVGHL